MIEDQIRESIARMERGQIVTLPAGMTVEPTVRPIYVIVSRRRNPLNHIVYQGVNLHSIWCDYDLSQDEFRRTIMVTGDHEVRECEWTLYEVKPNTLFAGNEWIVQLHQPALN